MRTWPRPSSMMLPGFEIAVQDAAVVRRGQSGAQLPRDVERLLGRQRPDAPQQRRERFAVDVLHRQVVPAFGFADVVDAADVRVRDVAGEADLGDEAVRRTPVRVRSLGASSFSATRCPSLRSSARYTSPVAPRPSRLTMR